MKIRSAGSTKQNTDILCGFVLEGVNESDHDAVVSMLGYTSNSTIDMAVAQSLKDMGGKLGKISIIPTPGARHADRIMLAGLGKPDDLSGDTIRLVSGKMAQRARDLGLGHLSIVTPPTSVADPSISASQIVEGAKMALYTFEHFKSEKTRDPPDLTVVSTPMTEGIKHAVKTAEIIADGVLFTRDVANMPPNECNPSKLADIAKTMSKKPRLVQCNVISKAALKRGGFGGITAVGQGSSNEPKLIVLEYDGTKTLDKKRPILLVGKAVTFDTGGISLKPGAKMDEMKFDKCGGCTVLGIIKAVSELKLPVHVVGIIPSVENMPGGDSYRPGDIIRLYNGKTAEIMNTDAEGRLILADALAYGEKHYSPEAIIDFATLTGACIIALGNNVAGVMSNNKQLVSNIMDSSVHTMEDIWELPLNQDYMDMIKSDKADMRNLGPSPAAGTITASAFLRNAIEDTPWVHIDIAGVAWMQPATKKKSYNPKGATGFGVRLIMDYIQKSLIR